MVRMFIQKKEQLKMDFFAMEATVPAHILTKVYLDSAIMR